MWSDFYMKQQNPKNKMFTLAPECVASILLSHFQCQQWATQGKGRSEMESTYNYHEHLNDSAHNRLHISTIKQKLRWLQ